MPVIRNYVVSQTREVNVRANSLTDAIRIAGVAFNNGQNSDSSARYIQENIPGIWGDTTTPVKETDITARESY